VTEESTWRNLNVTFEKTCLSRNPSQCTLQVAIHCSRWRSS